MSDHTRMLADIVRQNPVTLTTLAPKRATAVVEEIVMQNRMPLDVLTRAILDSRNPSELLKTAVRCLSNKPSHLYVIAMALSKCDGDDWIALGDTDTRYIAEVFSAANMFGLLAERNKEVLQDPDHPLFSLLSSDMYWEALIAHYLKNKDYLQAWSSAKQALRGYQTRPDSSSISRNTNTEFPDSRDCAYQVSTAAFGGMVRNIFDEMARHGLVSADNIDAEQRTITRETVVIRYQGVRKDGTNIPRPSLQTVDRSGYKYALRFYVPDLEQTGKMMYLPEGVMIYRIADYFVSKKHGASRQKWLDLCKERGVDPTTLEPQTH